MLACHTCHTSLPVTDECGRIIIAKGETNSHVSFYAISVCVILPVMQLENLHHFLNLHNNFWFNTFWHRQSMCTLILCRRLAESSVIVTLSVTCMDC